jgi:hypothetical protein
MLKRLTILGLLLAVTPFMPGQPNKAADQKQEPAKQGQPAVLHADSPNKQASSQADQPKANPNAPEWYTALERPDWWLVIVATLTAGVICWQSIETRKAAQSALLNAQAMITAERPWLVAHLKQFEEETIPESGRLRLSWEVKNVGKTPAKLIEADAVAVFNLDAVPLPDVPIYGYFPETLENRMLVPGDTYSFWAHWYELKDGRYIRLEKQNIGPRADLMVVFGYVKYRDTFDSTKEHISRFCDCTFISGSKVGGHVTNWDSAPAEYTECT